MKFNKWTLGLAAVGAVSLASAVRADEAPKMSQMQTALSNTTISGYVDVAAQYNINHTAEGTQPPFASTPNSFSVNDVDIAIDKPEDDTPWASGYHVDFQVGASPGSVYANTIGFGAIRQAYVVLRTPVGNGIDWKFGAMDDIIGYEGNTDGSNPNYTRSVGWFEEPASILGLVGSYTVNKMITVQAGVANATSAFNSFSDKAVVGSIALTAPDSWGWVKGATLNLGAVVNISSQGQQNYYAGITLPTPVSALKVGAAFDFIAVNNQFTFFNNGNDSGYVIGLYGSYQATDKLSLNIRGEFYDLEGDALNPLNPESAPSERREPNGIGEEVTATVQYNLWANVISRLEFRWDHADTGVAFGNDGGRESTSQGNSFILALNLIYQF